MKRWQKVVLAVVAIVAVVLIVASFILDGVLTSKAHEEAQTLSQQWKRPVEIGSVKIRLLTGLGARVSKVEIGPAKGESAPLVELQDVEVRVDLLALFKGVEVHDLEVRGLTVNIERLPDGKTNLERFQDGQAEKPKKAEPAANAPSDLSWLRIDHAALREGKIALLDKHRTLAIEHLDVTVDDLRAGKPLEVVLKAAVLAKSQNLELHLKAAPLPPTLMPTPTQLALKVDPPIDLAPLGPFAGKSVGLEGGKLEADFAAQLGAAVSGGEGKTDVKGTVKLLALQFRGGKPFDATLEADVKGDAAKGDVQIDKLALAAGPAAITGHGGARGLESAAPRIEGLEIVSRELDPEKLAAYYPPLRKQLGTTIAGPVGLSVKGSGTALELRVDLTPVKLVLPQQLAKAAGAPMVLVAHLNGAAKFDAKADLAGVDLRPGESLDKAPGQRLDLALQGTRSGPRLELADLKLHLLDDELEGRGFYESKGPAKKFDVQLQSSHLDLDKLLLPSGKKKERKPPDPKMFAGLEGHGKAQIDKLTYKKQPMTRIVADISLHDDHLKLDTAQLEAFGGTAAASGTELRLAHPEEPFHLLARLDSVALENLLALATEHKLLSGKFNGKIDLRGAGEWSKTLAGNVDGHVLDGVFYGKDLVASVSGPLAKALPFGLAGKEGQGGSTSLGKDLPIGVTIDKGVARLKNPIKIATPQADLTFSGGMRIDGQLDLPGTVALAPDTVAAITGGKVKPAQPLPVNLKLIGPAWSPTVTELDLKPAVGEIVKQGGSALVQKALGVDASQAEQQAEKKVEEEAKNRLKGLFGK